MPDSGPTPTNVTHDLSGRALADYELLRRLGSGGMADVYLARQTSLRRNVALKILKPQLAGDASYVRRFEREAQAAAALVQANIVQIYEVGEAEGYHFIAQEYVAGRNLKQYLNRYGAVEPVMAVNVLRQCALALQKANELGVVHRDIKPENIMLSTKGEVKITDFGLARIQNNSSQQALTQIGVTMGTPLYMSPEQVGGVALDHRSDIYSLGITAYHMLAGEPPFNGENALAIAVQHVNNPAAPLENVRPDLPPELTRIIESMMAKTPKDRPADAQKLLKELRKVKLDMDEDWELIIEKLSAAEYIGPDVGSHSQVQLAATRQLQQVMKGNIRSWWRSRGLWVGVVALLMFSGLAGAAWAIRTRPASLLNVEDFDNQKIPRKASIAEQYEAARWVQPDQQEKYLDAVLDYFPLSDARDRQTTQLYRRNAKARLGELYLEEQRWRDARNIYQEFSSLGELEEAFQVAGHAGLAIVSMNRPLPPNQTEDQRQTDVRQAIAGVGGRQDMLNEFLLQRYEKVLNQLDLQRSGS